MKRVKIELSEPGFSRAINEIRAYRESLTEKTERLKKRVADEIAEEAQDYFDASCYDDLTVGGMRKPNVNVSVEVLGNVVVVIADGEEAIFVEFGAGVYHNGASGASPHPNGASLGYTIGSYGENGKRRAWGFIGEDGVVHITRGTPAQMPMYRATQIIISKIPKIAREVFA